MSIKGIGVDIVDLTRLNLDHRHFIEKVLTTIELSHFDALSNDKSKLEYLGGRFAVKEAVLKAYGKGLGGMNFQDIEVLNHKSGAPYLNIPQSHVSISHDGNLAIAFVVIEEEM